MTLYEGITAHLYEFLLNILTFKCTQEPTVFNTVRNTLWLGLCDILKCVINIQRSLHETGFSEDHCEHGIRKCVNELHGPD
jgi:hypothetical protein